MTSRKTDKDWLLSTVQVLLALFIVLMIFVLAMLAIGLGAVLTVQRGELLAELSEAGAPSAAYWGILALFPLIAGMMFAALRVAQELGGIIRTVDEDDPFRPDNADRLTRMGWLMIALYALAFVADPLAAWLSSVTRRTPVDGIDLGGGGIFLILVLFVLARVFRKGTEMRADLEGTV